MRTRVLKYHNNHKPCTFHTLMGVCVLYPPWGDIEHTPLAYKYGELSLICQFTLKRYCGLISLVDYPDIHFVVVYINFGTGKLKWMIVL